MFYLFKFLKKLYFYYLLLFKKSDLLEPYVMVFKVVSKYSWTCRKLQSKFIDRNWSRRKNKLTIIGLDPVQRSVARSQVTVIVSLYDASRFLESFLCNVKEQSLFSEAQFIFISSLTSEHDKTILDQFCSYYSNCKVSHSEVKLSIYESWNLALQYSTSSLITNMNVDDIRSPDSLYLQVKFMNNNPNVDVGFQDFFVFRDEVSSWDYIKEANELVSLDEVNFVDMAWRGINSPHHAPIWRKSLHDELGFFNTEYVSAADYEFWLRALLKGKVFRKMGDLHAGYYFNPQGTSTKTESFGVEETQRIQIFYRPQFLVNEGLPKLYVEDIYINTLKEILTNKSS